MSEGKELIQSGGDQSKMYQAAAAMTVNDHSTTINYESRLAVMDVLVKKYYEEKKKGNNSEFAGYIRTLEKFTTHIDTDLKDLKTKLIEGGFELDYETALEAKEQYAMLLAENKFSSASQHIHAFLLAWLIVLYKQFVVVEIKGGKDKEAIKHIIMEKVIAPVERLVGGSDNVLCIYADDIQGMLYYLTGNCHIKWT